MPIEPNFNLLLATMEEAPADIPNLPVASPEYAEFPTSEYIARYAKAIKLMEDQGLDALLICQQENVRFFSGYLSVLWVSKFRPYVVILPRDPALGPTLVLPGQEEGNAEGTSWVPDRLIYADQGDAIAPILDALAAKGLAKPNVILGAELGFGMRIGMNSQQFAELETRYPGRIVDGTPVIQAVRMIKSPSEVAKLRKSCEISQIGVKAGFEALREGMTEKELLAVVCSAMYAAGAEPGPKGSFFSCTSGGNYKMANALAKDYAFRDGDFVMIDAGAVFDGYSTDFIRQACLGSPTPEQSRYYDIALEANIAAIDAVRPGVTGADVYETAMDVFKKYGVYDYNLLTIVGHGVGLDIHEVPWLGERDTVYTSGTVLEPGMVVCIEPVFGGYNDPDWSKGIWIQEEKVLITPTGAEVLTTDVSKDLWLQPLDADVALAR